MLSKRHLENDFEIVLCFSVSHYNKVRSVKQIDDNSTLPEGLKIAKKT